jgi:hypothetical protein
MCAVDSLVSMRLVDQDKLRTAVRSDADAKQTRIPG